MPLCLGKQNDGMAWEKGISNVNKLPAVDDAVAPYLISWLYAHRHKSVNKACPLAQKIPSRIYAVGNILYLGMTVEMIHWKC